MENINLNTKLEVAVEILAARIAKCSREGHKIEDVEMQQLLYERDEMYKGNKNIIIYIDPPYANTTGYKETFDIYSLEGQIWSTSPIYISEGYKMQGASESYLLSVGRTKGNISGEVKKKPTEEWLNRFNLI